MTKLRLAIIGCGFWSKYQSAAWKEFSEMVDIVAVCDKDSNKAAQLAKELGISQIYQKAEEMLHKEQPDFVEVITNPDTHADLVKTAADFGASVICQKPMAPGLEQAKEMVEYCKEKNIQFLIHENFRWQSPIRRLKAKLDQGIIGTPFKGNIKFCSSFPVFENQPLLAELEQFILTDVGVHILDIARFLFGEAASLYCQTHSINPKIKGEDVANVFIHHSSGVHCYAEMSYASILRNEQFPETFVEIEGNAGSLYLGPNYEILCTTKQGTQSESIILRHFDWVHPDYSLAHNSIYYCHENILHHLLGSEKAETTAADNLKTLQLVFDAYNSANENKVIHYERNPS